MDTIFTISPLVVAVVPLIVALVHIAKTLGLPSKFAPVMSLAFGVGILALLRQDLATTIISGLIAGLTASGLWSGVKSVATPTE